MASIQELERRQAVTSIIFDVSLGLAAVMLAAAALTLAIGWVVTL